MAQSAAVLCCQYCMDILHLLAQTPTTNRRYLSRQWSHLFGGNIELFGRYEVQHCLCTILGGEDGVEPGNEVVP